MARLTKQQQREKERELLQTDARYAEVPPAYQEGSRQAEGWTPDTPATNSPQQTATADSVRQIAIADIHIVADFNARRGLTDDDPRLDELKMSLEQTGLLQPIVVRPPLEAESGWYPLVAGERRLRAARSLGWSHILAHVKVMSDAEADQIMLAENVQRQSLTLLEEASAYDRMMAKHGWSQSQVAQAVGKVGSYISAIRKVARVPVLREELAQQLLSDRMALEIAALFDADGAERIPGAADPVLRWITVMRPSVQSVRQAIRHILDGGTVPNSITRAGTAPAPAHQTWGERRWHQWESRDRPVLAKKPGLELREAEQALLRMLAEVRQMLASRESHEDPAPDPPL